MKSSRRYFFGTLLIVPGVLFLGNMHDWFDIGKILATVSKFWPLLVILAGIVVLFQPNRSVNNPFTAILIAFAIPLGIYNASSNAFNNFKGEVNKNLNFDFDDESNDSDETKSDKFSENFSVPFENGVTDAKLNFGGAAATFHLDEAKGNEIFRADTKMFGSRFNLEHEKIGNQQDIVFNMESKGKANKFHFNNNGDNNDVFLKLNKIPTWDIILKLGAGDLNFDLSSYKVKNIEVSTGAANVELKMGNLLNETNINIESGVARVLVKVPKNAGCEIEMDGALNSKDFEGFLKKSEDNYQTENYSKSSQKIHVKVNSGLSSVVVERY